MEVVDQEKVVVSVHPSSALPKAPRIKPVHEALPKAPRINPVDAASEAEMFSKLPDFPLLPPRLPRLSPRTDEALDLFPLRLSPAAAPGPKEKVNGFLDVLHDIPFQTPTIIHAPTC